MIKKVFAVLVLAIASAGCVDSDFSLLLDGPIQFQGEVEGDVLTCTVETSAGAGDQGADSVLRDGMIVNLQDIEESGQFGQTPLGQSPPGRLQILTSVANRLQASDSYSPIGFDQNQRLNQNVVMLDRVEVSFPEDQNQAGFPALETIRPLTGIVGTEDAAFVFVTVFDRTTLNAWRAVVQGLSDGSVLIPAVVELQTFGVTSAGDEVESNRLRVPLQVCDGCDEPTTQLCGNGL